jgi:hypothetical protein
MSMSQAEESDKANWMGHSMSIISIQSKKCQTLTFFKENFRKFLYRNLKFTNTVDDFLKFSEKI